MRKIKNTLPTLAAATFISAATIGGAFAFDPDYRVGDASGDRPVAVQQQRVQNARALESARTVTTVEARGQANTQYRLQAQFLNAKPGSTNKTPLPILPFIGDWNGTAKPGFPHQ